MLNRRVREPDPKTRNKDAERERKDRVQKKGKARRKKREEYVQDSLPIQDIRSGVILTRDGRYIKLVEVEPINFALRSYEEQALIIASFASWLKISPARLQIKSVSRKADAGKHIASVRQDLQSEDNPQCLELAKEYIQLIQDVGNREALSRRFFLIFSYEPLPGRRNTHDFGEIYATLQTAVQNARSYFMQCGNAIVLPENEDAWIAETLYTMYNRRSCIQEPFSTRMERVVVDTMRARRKVIGVDPIPDIPVVDFLSPRGVDLTHISYIVMDGLYYSYLYIRGGGYPHTVRGGWMSALINAGEGIDIDIHLQRENRGRILDKVSQRIRLNKTKMRSVQDTSTDFEELSNSISAGYYIKSGISNYNEDLFYMSVFITICASSLNELQWRRQQMTDLLKSMDIYVSDCPFQQEQAFRCVSPLLQMDKNLQKKSRRNLLTSGAASAYLFTSFELSDDNGVLLGVNRHNNSLCVLDLFNSTLYKNANVTILGTTGAGKTFTMQLLALRMRMRGIQCYILAPLKGHEFRRACNRIGGSYIKISPGSRDCINIMEIRRTTSPEMALIDEIDYDAEESLLARKIQQLLTFFYLLVPDMTNEEEQMLDEALISTYRQAGITHDNDSLYLDKTHTRFKPMPILGDLHKVLCENELTRRLAVILSRFVSGSASTFNQQTNVDLDNKYIVLDISELKGKLLPVGMFIALDYVWDCIKADRTTRKAIFIDEVWQLIGASANRQAAEFVLEIWKIIRGYGGGAITATQDLGDFFSLDDGKYGRAILNNSKTKLVLNLEADEAQHVQETLKLTQSEIRSITQFERGEALLTTNANKVPVLIRASKAEQELITTDRGELEALLRQKQGERA